MKVLALVISLVCVTLGAHHTLEEAKLARERLVKKHLKRLNKEEGAVKLVGGRNEFEGNVEILHDNKWGAVCDDEWDKNEAEVVCRQLGYEGATKFTHSGHFGPAKRRFWMDNVFCDGSESELGKCRFDTWGQSDCDRSEAAGVICKAPKQIPQETSLPKHKHPKHKVHKRHNMEVRLKGGARPNEGRVEVRFSKGQWGTVCGDGWSLLEANVVCKSLGLGFANDAVQTDYFGGSNDHKLLVSGTECYGNETHLNDCVHHEKGRVFCPGSNHHVAAVMCTPHMSDLIFDIGELERSMHLEDKPLYFLQCAMEENCLASRAYDIQREDVNWQLETRRLLKFTASVFNGGTADFRPSIPKHMWEWHMCHMHYHSMEVFAAYNIVNSEGKKVAEGHKASFCLEDNQCNPGIEPKYACISYGDQGISVNCTDIYRYNIDCQWVDISELDVGTYTMTVAINPDFKVPEMNYDNNAAVCTLVYTEQYARVTNCKLTRP